MDKISALMDGEARQKETRHTISHLKESDDCCESWKVFHLIGDVMRGDPPLRDDFMSRFHARMESEPIPLTPRVVWRKPVGYALSAAASLAAIGVVSMMVFSNNPLQPQVQIAAAPVAPPPITPQVIPQPRPAPAVNQGRIIEYMMAHQEFSPSTALQGVAPYVRTVAETHDGSGR